MARYTGPKARINRRLGAMIYENGGPFEPWSGATILRVCIRARGGPPTTGWPCVKSRRSSIITAWVSASCDAILRWYRARRATRVEMLLMLCERRLDNVIRRAGFTRTRPQARQGIVHGHFQVNGVKVTKPSFVLRPAMSSRFGGVRTC